MTLVQRDPALHAHLGRLAREARIVVMAGLPGTGKSLVIHQLAHRAVNEGRRVHLLQWDVARPVFEASAAGRRYPVIDGVTQPMIRTAVGLWARRAIAQWQRRCAGREHLLIGEAPLIGGRLIELARRRDDEAEPVLADASCRFVVSVPSAAVRRHVEAERERRASTPRHDREREDAPPHVLRELWNGVRAAADALGIVVAGGARSYDPDVYRRVYEAVLVDRHPEIVALDTILPTASMSVYDFSVPYTDIVPRDDEVDALVRAAERVWPDGARLAAALEHWWAA